MIDRLITRMVDDATARAAAVALVPVLERWAAEIDAAEPGDDAAALQATQDALTRAFLAGIEHGRHARRGRRGGRKGR